MKRVLISTHNVVFYVESKLVVSSISADWKHKLTEPDLALKSTSFQFSISRVYPEFTPSKAFQRRRKNEKLWKA